MKKVFVDGKEVVPCKKVKLKEHLSAEEIQRLVLEKREEKKKKK